MSHVAEALQRAEEGGPGTDVDVRTDDTGRLESPDIATVSVPWDIEREPVSEPAARLQPVASPIGPRVSGHDRASGDFVELVQRVFRPVTGEPTARVVTFVSLGRAGAGRPIALEVGRALAAHGVGTVCVVDASFGAAALHYHADIPAGPGLCDALLASRPATSLAVQLGRQLWMVPAGEEMCAAPGWMPEALARALRQLSAKFDFVIVEAPSLEDGADMPAILMVAPLTDGAVLVLEADRTRRDVASDTAKRLRASGVAVLGAVLTSRKSTASPEMGGWL